MDPFILKALHKQNPMEWSMRNATLRKIHQYLKNAACLLLKQYFLMSLELTSKQKLATLKNDSKVDATFYQV